MFGWGSGNRGCWCDPCTIILIILILDNQCLLNTRDCDDNSSRNALTLLFLFWLCCSNGRFGGFGFGNQGFGNNFCCCCCDGKEGRGRRRLRRGCCC
ncbi:hypothetical protein [Clostridium sp. UBA6640]|uniref:hypothetical protein n=1 Tax=Clostridium sp. UBA6640 TaxID=1946370 RepID=UPI0025C44738|nr:hypothetical protein [Clostridium sp. UBA6640]